MSDTEDEFSKAFEGFGEDEAPVTPPVTPPADPPADPPKEDAKPPVEEPKKDEEPAKTPEKTPPAADDEKKKEEEPKPPETPETPPASTETPTPLTKDDVTAIISNLRNEERSSGKVLEDTTKQVLEAYYPEGLSNVLVDEKSGKELRTPQDVIDASGGEMSTEQATQWLMNEQFKLDKQVEGIKTQAKEIAETTVNFRRDAVAAVQKYEPLFKAYPNLQSKVYEKLMKQVKFDEKKGVILSAPDVLEHYDDYLEPYQQAFEYANNKPATNPTPDPNEPPKPTAEDRMDISGDGGATPPDDPNDFAQQVKKELSKPL
jgi:hypothetical protein